MSLMPALALLPKIEPEDPIAVLWDDDDEDQVRFNRLGDLIDLLADDDRLRSNFGRAWRMPWIGPPVEITAEVEGEIAQRMQDIRDTRAHESAGCNMQHP